VSRPRTARPTVAVLSCEICGELHPPEAIAACSACNAECCPDCRVAGSQSIAAVGNRWGPVATSRTKPGAIRCSMCEEPL
jgi:hypothetical protein